MMGRRTALGSRLGKDKAFPVGMKEANVGVVKD